MKGTEQIQFEEESLQKLECTLNWGYLLKGKGIRRVENVLQVIVGRVGFWVVFIIELGIIVSEILKGHHFSRIIDAEGIASLFFWLFAFIFLYSLYLLRDRKKFLDVSRMTDLFRLKKKLREKGIATPIEITDYLSHDVLWLFDYILNVSTGEYLIRFWEKLMKLDSAHIILRRLGINSEGFDMGILSQAAVQQQKHAVMRELLLESFAFGFVHNTQCVSEEVVTLVFIKKYFSGFLHRYNITQQDIDGITLWLENEAKKYQYIQEWKNRISLKPNSTVNRAYTSRYTATLNQYARDYTAEVINGDFKISIARERELDRMATVLEKGEKSAVLVIGEPGVGKTTLIKSLAVRMAVEDVPEKLQDKRLVGFDFNKAFTSSKDIDSFKQVLHDVFEDVAKSGNVVLVLDNFDQLLNLRSEYSGEIVNILVDAFDSYNLRIIATTNSGQYTRYIRPQKSLAALFTTVEMPIPSDQVSTQILFDEMPGIEREYNVRIAFSAVKGAVALSHKYAYERVLPDKAIDLLKETVVNFKQLAGKRPIGYEEVAQTVSQKVGVELGAIGADESEKLVHLEERMHQRVIGQNEAINSVSEALRRARAGISEGKRPVASFLFFGPTGVGKTEVAKTVAEVYYGSDEQMIRLDMSEYHEEENIARLLGYSTDTGSFEGGYLTEAVRDNPFSLVLLDEIEKANPKVLDLFLQVLDEGEIEDGLGRTIDFSNTIIIATSNAGSSVIADLLEKQQSYNTVRDAAMEELKKVFRIEFLNRFDKITMFKPLTRAEVKLVARKFVEQVKRRLQDKGIEVVYDDGLLDRLAQLGYSPVFGAREMRRVVQEQVENKIANTIVRGQARAGDRIQL